jgi:hypothetical protein
MQKLVYMLVAIAAISFASCGNKTAQAEGTDTTDTAPADTGDTTSADTTSVDTTS